MAVKTKLRPFGFEATFCASLLSKSMVIGLAYSSTSFERSNWYLTIMREKDLGSTFNHFMLIQNTPESCYNMAITGNDWKALYLEVLV